MQRRIRIALIASTFLLILQITLPSIIADMSKFGMHPEKHLHLSAGARLRAVSHGEPLFSAVLSTFS